LNFIRLDEVSNFRIVLFRIVKSNKKNQLRLLISHQNQMQCLSNLHWIEMRIEKHFNDHNSKKNENYEQRKRDYPTRS